jgi:hypothetical protein
VSLKTSLFGSSTGHEIWINGVLQQVTGDSAAPVTFAGGGGRAHVGQRESRPGAAMSTVFMHPSPGAFQ